MNQIIYLFIYPIIKDRSANYQIYGQYIDSSTFEMDSEILIILNFQLKEPKPIIYILKMI